MKRFEGYQRGINLGGWISQCKHEKDHYDTFITEKDIKEIASWGLDHIRVPLDYELLETPEGESKEEGFYYIDSCISWCQKYNLNMILDLHKTAGYSFNEHETAHEFFENTALQDRFVHLWEKLVKRYGKYDRMLAFELLNEVGSFSDSWNQIAKSAIEKIRLYAPTIKILIGGVAYNSLHTIKLLDEPYDENIVYNFHCYEPFLFTHQSAHWVANMPQDLVMDYPATLEEFREGSKVLGEMITLQNEKLTSMGVDFLEILFDEAVKIAEERNVPLYCGEYGVIDKAPLDSSLRWYQDIHTVFEKHKIGRSAWNYKKMDFGLIGEHYAPIYHELIQLL